MTDVKQILDDIIDAGRQAKQQNLSRAEQDNAAAAKAQELGYSLDDLLPSIRYYQSYGEVPDIDQFGFGAARELAGGALFEFADEIEGAFSIFDNDETVDQAIDRIRLNRQAYRAMNPGTALAANFAGGAVMGGAGLARTGAATLARTAGVGAGQGALTAVGDMQAKTLNPMDYAAPVAIGATLGGTLGAAGYGAARGIQNLRKSADTRALEKIGAAIDDANTTPRAERMGVIADARADRAAGQPSVQTLADRLGRPGARLTRGATVVSPQVDEAASRQLAARQEGVNAFNPDPDNPNLRILSQRERLTRELSPASSNNPDLALVDEFEGIQNRNPVVKGLYDKAFGISDDTMTMVRSPRLYELMAEVKVFAKAYRAAKQSTLEKLMVEQPFSTQAQQEARLALRRAVLDLPDSPKDLLLDGAAPPLDLPLEFLDQMKRQVGRIIYQSIKSAEKRPLDKKLLQQFTDELKKVAPKEYGQVLKITADDFAIKGAHEAGRNFGKSSARFDRFVDDFKGMTPFEKDAFRVGVLDEIIEGFSTKGDNRDFVQMLRGDENVRRKIEMLFEDDPKGLERFLRRIEREAAMKNTRRVISQQSNTADKIEDRNAIQGARMLQRLSQNPFMTVGDAIERRLQSTNVADAVGSRMLDTSPVGQAQTLRQVQAQPARLRELQARAARQALTGTGGLLGMAYGTNPSAPRRR